MEGSDFLLAGVLFLFAAVAAVPLASRLGIGAVLGYLLAGIAIGPWGLGFISDVDEILHFSELGVVFLMFIIGLELNPSKLWQLRRSIFGVGAAQVLLSAALLAGLLMLTDFAWQAAVVGGIGLAMSSTAMALQLMREKGMNRSESGQFIRESFQITVDEFSGFVFGYLLGIKEIVIPVEHGFIRIL